MSRYMLIDYGGDVVAEIKSPQVIALLTTVSILVWRKRNYIYSAIHQNGEYEFYQEAGDLAHLGDSALEIR